MKYLFVFYTLAITFSMIQAQELVEVKRDCIITWNKEKLLKFFGDKYIDSYFNQGPLWDVLNLDVLKTDCEVKKAFDFAVDYLLEYGVTQKVLDPKATYAVYTVNMIQQNQANKTLYYFDITFKNECYDHKLVRFTTSVYIVPETCKLLIEYPSVYTNVLESEPNIGYLDYYYKTSFTWEQFQKNKGDIQNIFLYGLNSLIKIAIEQKALNNAFYYIDQLYAAAVAPSKGKTYYFFDASIYTQTLGYVEVNFIIKSSYGKLELEKYSIFTI